MHVHHLTANVQATLVKRLKSEIEPPPDFEGIGSHIAVGMPAEVPLHDMRSYELAGNAVSAEAAPNHGPNEGTGAQGRNRIISYLIEITLVFE